MNKYKEVTKYDSSEIFKAVGLSSFVTIDVSSVTIDKIMLVFHKYNESNEKGNRIEKKASIYLSPLDALMLSRQILSGSIANLTNKAILDAKSKGKKYGEPIYSHIGGSKNLCRVFQISPSSASLDPSKSTQSLYNLKAMTGKAKVNSIGGISPDFKFSEAETQINLAINNETLISIGFILEQVGKHYLEADIKQKIDKEIEKANKKLREVS